MEWAAIIAALLQVFGPVIARLLEQWLTRAAEHLPRPDPDSEHAGQIALLFDAAITHAPKRHAVALRILRRHAMTRASALFAVALDPRSTAPVPLSSSERAEVIGVAG